MVTIEEYLRQELATMEQRIIIKLGGLMVVLFGIATTVIKFSTH
jgi:hypothetical protein